MTNSKLIQHDVSTNEQVEHSLWNGNNDGSLKALSEKVDNDIYNVFSSPQAEQSNDEQLEYLCETLVDNALNARTAIEMKGIIETALYHSHKHTKPQAERSVQCDYKTTIIALLNLLKPNYGDIGSRDVDVTAKRKSIDDAIAMLSVSLQVKNSSSIDDRIAKLEADKAKLIMLVKAVGIVSDHLVILDVPDGNWFDVRDAFITEHKQIK